MGRTAVESRTLGIKHWLVPKVGFEPLIVFTNEAKLGCLVATWMIGNVEFNRCTQQKSWHMHWDLFRKGTLNYCNSISLDAIR
jgi:hypothetical protein